MGIPDQSERETLNTNGCIVVVAKCPIPSKSKTRLIPLLGEKGAADLAKAMLCDVLTNLATTSELDNVHKILYFAPSSGEKIMSGILQELGFESKWTTLPMLDGNNLLSSDLGHKLTHALIQGRIAISNGPVMFLGMDSPELPLDEIESAIHDRPNEALLCPADDGGYGMLSVPSHVDANKVFLPLSAGKRWSTSLTALAQIKALTDEDVLVRLGRIMFDMDEPKDIAALCQRLESNQMPGDFVTEDCLRRSSSGNSIPRTGNCGFTRIELEKLGQLKKQSI